MTKVDATQSRDDIQDTETALLLEGSHQTYGHDLREYARDSVIRRLTRFMWNQKLPTISSLQDRVLHGSAAMSKLVETLSVDVTSIFRGAEFYRALSKHAPRRLQTYPCLRLWVAGCSVGEESYSLAICLHEEGLRKKSRIYATDFVDTNVQQAKSGISPPKSIKTNTQITSRLAGIAAVLSGDDAPDGAHIHRRGGRVLLQDPSSVASAIMPQHTLHHVPPALVLIVENIGKHLLKSLKSERLS